MTPRSSAASVSVRSRSLISAAEIAAERLRPYAGLIEPINDRTCFLDAGASTFESLAMHLVLLGVDFEISEPVELMEEIRRVESYATPPAVSSAVPLRPSAACRLIQEQSDAGDGGHGPADRL